MREGWDDIEQQPGGIIPVKDDVGDGGSKVIEQWGGSTPKAQPVTGG